LTGGYRRAHNAQMSMKPLPYEYKRQTLQIPLETLKAFQGLADAMGRTLPTLMVDFLGDCVPVVQSMETEVRSIFRTEKDQQRRLLALASAVNQATESALSTAKGGPFQGGQEPGEGGSTPPYSNTGGNPNTDDHSRKGKGA
jgi:hypothetical protein